MKITKREKKERYISSIKATNRNLKFISDAWWNKRWKALMEKHLPFFWLSKRIEVWKQQTTKKYICYRVCPYHVSPSIVFCRICHYVCCKPIKRRTRRQETSSHLLNLNHQKFPLVTENGGWKMKDALTLKYDD